MDKDLKQYLKNWNEVFLPCGSWLELRYWWGPWDMSLDTDTSITESGGGDGGKNDSRWDVKT